MKLEFHSNDAGFYGVGLTSKEREVWFQILPYEEWHLGYKETWYDGPIKMFGFGFFEVQWHRPI